jgi:hypothetical protein
MAHIGGSCSAVGCSAHVSSGLRDAQPLRPPAQISRQRQRGKCLRRVKHATAVASKQARWVTASESALVLCCAARSGRNATTGFAAIDRLSAIDRVRTMPAPTAQSDAERVAKSRSRLYLSIQYEQAKYTAATRYLRPTLLRCSAHCGKGNRSPTAEGTSTSPSQPARARAGPGWARLGRAGEG